MSGYTLRQAHLGEFRHFDRQSKPAAAAIVALFVVQLAGAIALGSWLLSGPVGLAEALGAAALALFVATRLRGFNNIVHECSHATFTRDRPANAVFGRFCAALVLGSFRVYRAEHMTHHAHLGDPDLDRDLHGIRALRLEEPLTPGTIARHIVTPLIGRHLPYYVGADFGAADGRAYQVLKLALAGAAVAFLVVAPVPALVMVWLPFLWLYTALNYWTDCIDHAGLLEAGDELQASRNLVVPRLLRALVFPRNDCFHLVHHLFPQVPSQHLEACHRQLMNDPAYRARAGAAPRPPAHAVAAE